MTGEGGSFMADPEITLGLADGSGWHEVPRYVLVTFVVTHDGEPLLPMEQSIARVDLDDDGQPTEFALAAMTERIRRAAVATAARPARDETPVERSQ